MCFSVKSCTCYILSLIFLCSTLAVDPSKICPPSQLIEPCVCRKNCPECANEILCKNVTDQEVLSRVFTSEYQFYSFTLKQASVMYIPDSLFEVLRLRTLTVEDSSLVTLFSSTPTTENSITFLFLEKVQVLRGFEWKVLSGFNKLGNLVMKNTHAPSRIDQSFIDHAPKSLRRLIIDNCSTTAIHDEAFASLPNLVTVSVLYGKIKEVKRSMFPTPSKLLEFGFSGNRLSSLPEDIFRDMPNLQYIYLEGNLLMEMPEIVFGPVFSNLLYFRFDANPLKCRCNIRWITRTQKKMQPSDFIGSCQEPKNLHGRSIRDLVPDDFSHCV